MYVIASVLSFFFFQFTQNQQNKFEAKSVMKNPTGELKQRHKKDTSSYG